MVMTAMILNNILEYYIDLLTLKCYKLTVINQYPVAVAKSIDLQQICRANFGVDFTISQIIADDLTAGNACTVTVFMVMSGDMYAYCQSETLLTLRDVKRLMRRVGIDTAEYLPPAGQRNYFTNHSIQAFKAAFPGRTLHADDDLTFYESLAPYSPALIRVSEIAGELHAYQQAFGQWQKALDYNYKRIV